MADPSIYTRAFDLSRKFLRHEYELIDPKLPSLLAVLNQAGAGECSHKHGTFYEHLLGTYRILKLWGAPDSVARCGLMHSVYSNSYINLAIFDLEKDRQKVRDLVGETSEHLIYLFCVVPRHEIIHDMLLFKYSDEQILATLHGDADELEDLLESVRESAKIGDIVKESGQTGDLGIGSVATGETDEKELMRTGQIRKGTVEIAGKSLNDTDLSSQKHRGRIIHPHHLAGKEIQGKIVPEEGFTVKNIRTGEEMQVSRRLVAIFLLLTMADFADQYFSWQDELFENTNGKLEFKGNNWTALWPGDAKPGLWMSSISRMGAILNLLLREEKEKRIMHPGNRPQQEIPLPESPITELFKNEVTDLWELIVPPIYNDCSMILATEDQIMARDLYMEAVAMDVKEKGGLRAAAKLLEESSRRNPWIGEPRIVWAQINLCEGKFEAAEAAASAGIRCLVQWGTCWDKRMSWEGWVAWARFLLSNAKAKNWPHSSWGIINLGLVK